MKLQNAVKKVAAVGAGITMLGATLTSAMAVADLSDYPAPFVQNGQFDAFLVVGAAAASSDVIGSVDIAVSLQASAVIETPVSGAPGAGTTLTSGVRLGTSSSPLWLGVGLADSKTRVTGEDLNVLRNVQFLDDNGKRHDVRFEVTIPNADVAYDRFEDSNDDPVMYVDFATNGASFDMISRFQDPLDLDLAARQPVQLFGRTFSFAGAGDLTAANDGTGELVLYRGALEETLEAGSVRTVELNGQDFRIEVVGVLSGNPPTAAVIINGRARQLSEGQTLTVDGERFYVSDILAYEFPQSGGVVTFFVGADQIVFKEGQPIEDGEGNRVDGTSVAMEWQGTNLRSLTVSVTPDDFDLPNPYEGMQVGEELVDPVFGAIKFAFTDVVPGLMAESRDYVRFQQNSNDFLRLTFTNAQGTEYTENLLWLNRVSTFWEARYGTTGDRVYQFFTGTGAEDLVQRNRIVILDDESTRIMELTRVYDGPTAPDDELVLRDVGSGQQYTFKGGEAIQVGAWEIPDASWDIDASGLQLGTAGGMVAVPATGFSEPVVYTRHGLMHTVSGLGTVNADVLMDEASQFAANSARQEDWTIRFTGSGTDEMGAAVQAAPLGWSGAVAWDSDDDLVSGVTVFGTYVWLKQDSDSMDLRFFYPADEAYVNVYVAPATASAVTGVGEGVGVSQSVQRIAVGAAILDTQAEAQNLYGRENLIVVGGPCGNTVAARLMGNPEVCTEGFERGRGMVKMFDHAGGKVSMLVAGFSAGDTTLAAQVVANYAQFEGRLVGKEIVVSGQSVNNVVISAPSMQ